MIQEDMRRCTIFDLDSDSIVIVKFIMDKLSFVFDSINIDATLIVFVDKVHFDQSPALGVP